MTLNLLIFDFGFWIGGYKVRRGTREPNRTVGSLPFQGSVLRPITITVNGYQGYQDLRAHSGDKGGSVCSTLEPLHRNNPCKHWAISRSEPLQNRNKALQGVTRRYSPLQNEEGIEH